jgi:type IV pilus assembly protein PilA
MNRFRKQKNQKGFTMIELMVVVVIVGILAAIAIPIYGKYIKNARMTEATGRIGEIITAEKAYAIEHDGDYTTTSQGIVDLSSTENFDYTVAGTDTSAVLTITAAGTTSKVGLNTTVVAVVDGLSATAVITTTIAD